MAMRVTRVISTVRAVIISDNASETSWEVTDRGLLHFFFFTYRVSDYGLLDYSNWYQITRKIMATDLSAVKTFALQQFGSEVDEETILQADPNVLRRCRSLEHLVWSSDLPRGFFQWAVDEKVAWDKFNAAMELSNGDPTVRISQMPSLPLIPLKSFRFNIEGFFQDELGMAAIAFGDNLNRIVASSRRPHDVHAANEYNALNPNNMLELVTDHPDKIHIGPGWRLPLIKELDISTQNYPLIPDQDLFSDVISKDIETLCLREPGTLHLFRHPGLSTHRRALDKAEDT